MIRYYFDIRDNTGLYRDEEGLEFSTQREAEVEAAQSLAGAAKAVAITGEQHDVSIEVRTRIQRIFRAKLIFDATETKH